MYFIQIGKDKTKKSIRKTKLEILKKVKKSIMIEEIIDEGIEKIAKLLKAQRKQKKQLITWKTFMKRNKCNILCLAYQQGQMFEKLTMTKNFLDMVKKFGISKSIILFKISTVKLVNKYPRMKKPSLSLHFLKNNFKMNIEVVTKMLVNI